MCPESRTEGFVRILDHLPEVSRGHSRVVDLKARTARETSTGSDSKWTNDGKSSTSWPLRVK